MFERLRKMFKPEIELEPEEPQEPGIREENKNYPLVQQYKKQAKEKRITQVFHYISELIDPVDEYDEYGTMDDCIATAFIKDVTTDTQEIVAALKLLQQNYKIRFAVVVEKNYTENRPIMGETGEYVYVKNREDGVIHKLGPFNIKHIGYVQAFNGKNI